MPNAESLSFQHLNPSPCILKPTESHYLHYQNISYNAWDQVGCKINYLCKWGIQFLAYSMFSMVVFPCQPCHNQVLWFDKPFRVWGRDLRAAYATWLFLIRGPLEWGPTLVSAVSTCITLHPTLQPPPTIAFRFLSSHFLVYKLWRVAEVSVPLSHAQHTEHKQCVCTGIIH